MRENFLKETNAFLDPEIARAQHLLLHLSKHFCQASRNWRKPEMEVNTKHSES